jgi:hypothetical protein
VGSHPARNLGAAGVAVLVIGCLLIGCAGSGDDGDGGGGGGPPRPTCEPPEPTTVSYSKNIQPLFDQTCALAGCHIPPLVNEGLDMSAARAYGQLVGRPSRQVPRLQRVKPGDPDNSYLILKLPPNTPPSGVPMPQGCPGAALGGSRCLTLDEVEAIRTWISECATRN